MPEPVLLPARAELLPAVARPLTAQRLVEDWLASQRSPQTRTAYQRDLARFARWLGAEGGAEVLRALVDAGPAGANALVLEYRTWLREQGKAPATCNRYLSSIRSLVALARTLGLPLQELRVRNLPSRAYRDTRGPGRQGVLALLAQAGKSRPPRRQRDRAIVRLLYDLALRVGEACALDLEDVDLEAQAVRIRGKGRLEDERLGLPDPTRAALASWLEVRGAESGPLFHRLDGAAKDSRERLTDRSARRMIGALARRAGLAHVAPHGLRHAAVTEALELTGGNVRAVARFSRHRRLDTVLVYDDAREDLAGQVARQVAGAASE